MNAWLFFAQESINPVSEFFQYGVSGLVLAAILMGLLWAKPAVDNIIKRAERAEAQRDELLKVYEDKIIPKLIATDEVMNNLKPLIVDVLKVLEAVKEQQAAPKRRGNG